MSAVLVNLAMVVGFFLCVISLVSSLAQGIQIWTALFRSAIVLAVGTVVVMAFFRFFNVVLFRFLNEKLKEHRENEEAESQGVEEPEG